MSWLADLAAVLRGVRRVNSALVEHQRRECLTLWRNSSIREAAINCRHQATDNVEQAVGKASSLGVTVAQKLNLVDSNQFSNANSFDRYSKEEGSPGATLSNRASANLSDSASGKNDVNHRTQFSGHGGASVPRSGRGNISPNHTSKRNFADSANLSKFEQLKPVTTSETLAAKPVADIPVTVLQSSLSKDSKETIKDLRESSDISGQQKKKKKKDTKSQGDGEHAGRRPQTNRQRPLADKEKFELNRHAKERKVPGSRIERLASFGNLGVGLAMGTLTEVIKRSLGGKGDPSGPASAVLNNNPFLTKENAERIVNTLCRVRGAALKLGQMLSIQDNSLISPELQAIMERVRQSADYMPTWQMERVLASELGSDWRTKFTAFDSKPFAAASIGQVHQATLLDGRSVALKIQYPGVAQSINSDIDNLVSLLNVWHVLPEGLHADTALKVAKHELAWECDYIREAHCSDKFKDLLKEDPVFYVPGVIWDLSTKQVLTTELVSGEPIDKFVNSDQKTRNFISAQILRLCLSEVFQFNFMQTDPNWSNFLFDPTSQRISLIDFGASREFSRAFTDIYIQVIKAASVGDRGGVLEGSRKMGFLTGYETKLMENAHVDAVMILGEAFSDDAPFDFGRQSTAARIHALMPVMLKHRLTPPPEETYSLHRKMAGCFLVCAKLRATINCKGIFDEVYAGYQFQANSEQRT